MTVIFLTVLTICITIIFIIFFQGNQHSEDLLGPNKYPLQSNNYFYHSYQVGSHQAKPAFVGASPTKSPLPPDSLVQRPVPKVWLHLYPKYKPTSPPYSAPSMADKPHATPVKYPDSSNPMSQVQESESSDFSYKPTSRPKQLGSGPLQSNMAHHISMQSNLVQNFQNNIGTGSFGAHNGGQHIKTEEISPSIQYKPTSRPMEPSLPNHDLHTNDVQYKPTSKPVMPPKSTMRPLISRPNPTEASLWPGNHPGSVNHPASTQDSGGNIPWSPVAGQIMGVFHYKPTHTPEQLQHPKPIASAIDSSQNSVPSTSTTVPTTTTEESTTASTLPPTYKPTVKPGVLVTDLDFNIPNRPVNLPIDLSQQVEAQPTAPTTTTTTTKAATILVSLTSTAPTTARTTTTTTPSSGVNPSTTTTVPTSQVFDLYDLVESLAISIDEFLRGIFDINYIGKTLSDLTAALVDTGSDTSVLLLVFGIPLLTAILTFAGVGPLIIIAIAWVVPVAAALLLPSTTSSFKEELEASASRLFNLR